MIGRIALAALVVMTCSVEVKAQQPIRGQVISNNVQVNNNWGGGGWNRGYGNYTYNCVGCFPGAGPYDSTIAVAGIAAGASVINNIINSATASRQPQVIVQQAPPVVIAAPVQQIPGVVTIPGTVYSSGVGCVMAPTGMSTEGVPVYQRYCR